jgi:hypothetical protein
MLVRGGHAFIFDFGGGKVGIAGAGGGVTIGGGRGTDDGDIDGLCRGGGERVLGKRIDLAAVVGVECIFSLGEGAVQLFRVKGSDDFAEDAVMSAERVIGAAMEEVVPSRNVGSLRAAKEERGPYSLQPLAQVRWKRRPVYGRRANRYHQEALYSCP